MLCQLPFVIDAVLDDVDFVQRILPPELVAAIADVTNLEHVVLADFALDAQRPRLDIANLNVRVESVYRISDQTAVRINRLSRDAADRQSARAGWRWRKWSTAKVCSDWPVAEGQVAVGGECPARISTDNRLEDVGAFTDGSHREAAAKYCLSRVADELMQKTLGEIRAVGKAKARQKNPGVVVSLGALPEESVDGTVSGQCSRLEEIAHTRLAKQVVI